MKAVTTRTLGAALGAAAAGSIGIGAFGAAGASATPRQDLNARSVVYTMTNSTSGNSVQAYELQGGGKLTLIGTYPTGGLGTGASGFSQGSLTLSGDRHTLLAVNAGSNQVSDFAVAHDGTLRLIETVASGGGTPTSVAIDGNLVEVLNTGGALPNVSGFWASHGGLTPISGGSQPLSPGAASPEDVAISPDGSHVVVTEKVSNSIDTFALAPNGRLGSAVTSPSDTPLAFAAAFLPSGQLLVADDGAANASALSSYRIADDGTLSDTQPSLPDAQTAACWVVAAPNGDVFVDNAGSGSMASYEVLPDGRLAFLGNTSAGAGAHPVDNAISSNGRYLFVLDANLNQISLFAIGDDAQLSLVSVQPVTPGSAGIAAG